MNVIRRLKWSMPVFFIACTLFAYATPPVGREVLAKKLVGLLSQKALFSSFERTCQNPSGTLFDPKALYKSAPEGFGGLTPTSANWPKVEASYRKYLDRVCGAINSLNAEALLTTSLSKQLSESDLQSAIAFYSSPVGARMAQAHVQAYLDVQLQLQTELSSVSQRESKVLTTEIQELLRQQRLNPK